MVKLTGNLQQTNLSANFQKKQLGVSVSQRLNIVQPTEHRQLLGLTYEESGHIGFASEEALRLVEENAVPKKLTMMNVMQDTADRSNAFLFVDNNGTPERVSVKNVLSKIIRTSNTMPDDMQSGEYLLLKKE